jgi:signal transduction histidine kinase
MPRGSRSLPRGARTSSRGIGGTRDWSLRRRLAALFIIAGILGAAVATFATIALVRVDQGTSRVIDTVDPADFAVLNMFANMLDEETGLRGYGLTKETSFLQPYQQGLVGVAEYQRQAETLLAGHPQLLAQLRTVEADYASWQTSYVQPSLAVVSGGGAVSDHLSAIGKAHFDTIRTDLAALESGLSISRTHSRDELDSALSTRWAWIITVISLAIAVGATTVLGIRRWVTVPLDRLGAETRTVAAGDISHPINAQGPREVTELGDDVERMRRELEVLIGTAREAQDAAERARAQIDEQAGALRRSNAELEQFAYVASHDLQEPLRKVASFCQLLEQRYADQLDDRARTYIGFAVDGAKRMQALINDLLSFSRTGRTSTGFSSIDLGAPFARAVSDLSKLIEESGAAVTRDPLPKISGDASLLSQLFANLIGNAVKFHSDRPPGVHFSCRRTGHFWTLACTDNGIGIEPQYAEKIFVIFQRLHAKDVYPGTGIGLALCKKIVEYHGGQIWLDTEFSGGTRFCFTLPVLPVLPVEKTTENPLAEDRSAIPS